MDFLTWLENSALGNWVATSSWAYPWVNSFHSIGMGFLVGIMFIIILRVLGVGGYALSPLGKFVPIVRIAFALNLVTGFCLLSVDATTFFSSPTFLIKLTLVVLGLITSIVLTQMLFNRDNAWTGSGPAPAATKAIAIVALVCWTGAILAGRMTAYLP